MYYRGSWCPICRAWLQDWLNVENFEEQLRDAGGTFLIVSSQTQQEVDDALDRWGLNLPQMMGIGDPNNEIALLLRKDYSLNVAISGAPGPYKTRGYTYPHGMAQPACLIANKRGKVLYSWATVPKMRNLMGAIARPPAMGIWNYAMIAMKADQTMAKPRGKSLRYMISSFRSRKK